MKSSALTLIAIVTAPGSIRNRLTALKKDRTEYLRAKDVLDIYASLMTQVTRLNDIRARPADTESTMDEPQQPQEENRVDTILNDVFQLLSLFFLRIGKSRESPATFCQLGTMKRLLTHCECLREIFALSPLTKRDLLSERVRDLYGSRFEAVPKSTQGAERDHQGRRPEQPRSGSRRAQGDRSRSRG